MKSTSAPTIATFDNVLDFSIAVEIINVSASSEASRISIPLNQYLADSIAVSSDLL